MIVKALDIQEMLTKKALVQPEKGKEEKKIQQNCHLP